MKLHRLRVKDFRAIDEVEITFPAQGVTVLEGPNETGKSSLLEAFNLLLNERHRTTSRKVQAARPADRDAHPEIEAELCIGPYRMVAFKRFHHGAAGQSTLRIVEPQAETLTGDESHNRLQQVLEQHLDRTLWEALQVTQTGALSQALLDKSNTLRTALDDAAGKRDDEEHANASLFARVQAEFERYYTAARANETGELASARRAAGEAESRAAELDRRVRSLDALVGRIESLEGELQRLEGQVGPARDEAEQQRGQLLQIEQLEAALQEHESAVQAAEAALRANQSQWQQRQELELRVRELARDTGDVESEQEELEPRIKQAFAALEAAREASQRAEEALAAASDFRLRANDDEMLLRTAWSLRELEQRIALADAISEERSRDVARLSTITIDAERVAMLRELANQAAISQRQAEDGATAIEIRPLAALNAEVDGHPLPVQPGQPSRLVISKSTVIRIPGVAEFTVVPPPGALELADQSRQRQARLERELAEANVGSIEEAQERLDEREALERNLATIPTRIREVLRDLPNITELRDKAGREQARLAGLRSRVPEGYQLPATITDAESRRREADNDEARGHTELEALRASEAQAREAHDRLRAQRAALESKLTVLQPQLAHARRQLNTAEAEVSREELQQRTANAHEAHKIALEKRDTERARFQDAQPETIRARAQNALSVAEGLERKLQHTRETLAVERRLLEEHSSEGLFELAEEAASLAEHAREHLAAVERRAQAARLLFNTLRETRTAAQRRYAGPLSQTIDQLGRILYGPGFRVYLGEDLTIRQRELDGILLDFEQLSGGAKEQLAILARVATAMLVQPGSGVPLIIDDALGYTDPERLKAMGAVLSMAGSHCQVIVLTCFPGRYEHVGGATVIRIPG